jgi:hypothetical protein
LEQILYQAGFIRLLPENTGKIQRLNNVAGGLG